jgi:hypothetical protein
MVRFNVGVRRRSSCSIRRGFRVRVGVRWRRVRVRVSVRG